MELKADGEKISIIAVKPYKTHGDNFFGEEKFSLGRLLSSADEVICLADEYRKGCFQRRNEYMVDRSGKLIAVVSDYRSGTGATIRYAEKQGIEVRTIDAKTFGEQVTAAEDSNGEIDMIWDSGEDKLAF